MASRELYPAASAIRPAAARNGSYARCDRFAIPLAHPFALHFFVKRLWIAQSRGEMLRAWLARGISRVSFARPIILRLMSKGASTAAGGGNTPEASGSDAKIPPVWPLLRGAGIILGDSPCAIVLDDFGHSGRGKTVMVVFATGAKEPAAVVKTSGLAHHASSLKREQDVLCGLRELPDARLRATLPAPLGIVDQDAQVAAAEGYLHGTSMYLQMRNSWLPRRNVDRHFRLARKWLVQFRKFGPIPGEPDAGPGLKELASDAFGEFTALCAPSEEERRLIAKLTRKVEKAVEVSVGAMPSQGDFWAGNLVVGQGDLGVFDWESYRECGLPLYDMLTFTTSYALTYPWSLGRYASAQKAFEGMYAGEGWLGRLARRHLIDHCAELGISPSLLEILMPAFLAMRAVEEHTKAQAGSIVGRHGPTDGVPSGVIHGTNAVGSIWRTLFQTYARMEAKGLVFSRITGN